MDNNNTDFRNYYDHEYGIKYNSSFKIGKWR